MTCRMLIIAHSFVMERQYSRLNELSWFCSQVVREIGGLESCFALEKWETSQVRRREGNSSSSADPLILRT